MWECISPFIVIKCSVMVCPALTDSWIKELQSTISRKVKPLRLHLESHRVLLLLNVYLYTQHTYVIYMVLNENLKTKHFFDFTFLIKSLWNSFRFRSGRYYEMKHLFINIRKHVKHSTGWEIFDGKWRFLLLRCIIEK